MLVRLGLMWCVSFLGVKGVVGRKWLCTWFEKLGFCHFGLAPVLGEGFEDGSGVFWG